MISHGWFNLASYATPTLFLGFGLGMTVADIIEVSSSNPEYAKCEICGKDYDLEVALYSPLLADKDTLSKFPSVKYYGITLCRPHRIKMSKTPPEFLLHPYYQLVMDQQIDLLIAKYNSQLDR